MFTNLYVVSTLARDEKGFGGWMNTKNARAYAEEFVVNPIAKQIVVMGPTETYVWHRGEGWVTLSTTEFKQRMKATLS